MPKTAFTNYEAVKAALDFPTVLSHYDIATTGSGDQLKIICPFHEDHKPSCGVHTTNGVFNCFSCTASGNIFDFVVDMEGGDAKNKTGLRAGALKGIEIMQLDPADFGNSGGNKRAKSQKQTKPSGKKSPTPRQRPAKKQQDDTHDEGQKDETKAPINPPLTFELDLEQDHPFFEERDISKETIARFGLGYCKKGIMAGRICIPLHNDQGELVAYAGRYAADDLPDDSPRYKLPKGFQKAHVLFNLHRIKQQPDTKRLVIVEG